VVGPEIHPLKVLQVRRAGDHGGILVSEALAHHPHRADLAQVWRAEEPLDHRQHAAKVQVQHRRASAELGGLRQEVGRVDADLLGEAAQEVPGAGQAGDAGRPFPPAPVNQALLAAVDLGFV